MTIAINDAWMRAAVDAHPRGAVVAPRKSPPPVPACPCASGQVAGACSICDAYPWDPPREAQPVKPTCPEVAPLVAAYLAEHPAGGALHIVLDDGNVDDASVAFCVNEAIEQGDADGEALARLLLAMSKTQRRKLARMPLGEVKP